MKGQTISRGDIWLADLNPVRGHEQKGVRPCLILSVDLFNTGPAGLVIVVPLTSVNRKIPLHIEINPPDGGVKSQSFAMCEMVRSISSDRLIERWGIIADEVMQEVEDKTRILLGL